MSLRSVLASRLASPYRLEALHRAFAAFRHARAVSVAFSATALFSRSAALAKSRLLRKLQMYAASSEMPPLPSRAAKNKPPACFCPRSVIGNLARSTRLVAYAARALAGAAAPLALVACPPAFSARARQAASPPLLGSVPCSAQFPSAALFPRRAPTRGEQSRAQVARLAGSIRSPRVLPP